MERNSLNKRIQKNSWRVEFPDRILGTSWRNAYQIFFFAYRQLGMSTGNRKIVIFDLKIFVSVGRSLEKNPHVTVHIRLSYSETGNEEETQSLSLQSILLTN